MSAVIRLTCRACAQNLEVDSGVPERVVECPKCSNPIRIPDAEELEEIEARARHQSQQQQLVLTRGRRLALRAGGLIIVVNLLFVLSLQGLPHPDAVEANYQRAAQGRRAATAARYEQIGLRDQRSATQREVDESYDRGWGASMYQKQLLWHAMLSAVLIVAGTVLLVVLIAARSKSARILLGLLSLVVPVVAVALCFHPDSVLPRYLDSSSAALFIGAGVLRLMVCFGAAYVLFRSASIIAYTARPNRAPSRPALRVTA